MKLHRIASLACGVELWDATDVLPRHRRKEYPRRDTGAIDVCFVHHSGAHGASGLDFLVNSASYAIRPRWKGGRGWPGFPYTFGVPYTDPNGRVYRGNPDNLRTWHTGGDANGRGIAVVLQGNLRSTRPSDFQYRATAALLEWIERTYGITEFIPHSGSKPYGGSGKRSCPGPWVEEFLRIRRVLGVRVSPRAV